jgi:hypothetical protein
VSLWPRPIASTGRRISFTVTSSPVTRFPKCMPKPYPRQLDGSMLVDLSLAALLATIRQTHEKFESEWISSLFLRAVPVTYLYDLSCKIARINEAACCHCSRIGLLSVSTVAWLGERQPFDVLNPIQRFRNAAYSLWYTKSIAADKHAPSHHATPRSPSHKPPLSSSAYSLPQRTALPRQTPFPRN